MPPAPPTTIRPARWRSLASAAVFPMLAAGCQLKSRTLVEPAPVASVWSVESPGEVSSAWLEHFGDPEVVELVREAVVHNRDLQASAARLDAARAGVLLAGADLFPQIGAATRGSRSERLSEEGRLRPEDYALSLNVAWEIDLWGRLRNRDRAAEADARAAEADYRAARFSVAANTAQAWFNVIEARLLAELAERTLESFVQDAAIARDQFKRGIGDSVDILLTATNVASTESSLKATRRNWDAASRSLETLLGRYPAALVGSASDFPTLRRDVPAGLPSELLMRRPDLLAAEQRLLAAWARGEDARKNRLPSLRLTGSRGTASDEFEDLFDANDVIGSIAAGLLQPVFEGGRLRGERDRAAALRDEALADYAGAILRAFREVETALAAERWLREEEASLTVAQRHAIEAEQKARELWQRGLEPNILTLLEAQRRSINTQQNLLRVRNLRLQNRLDLYLALGGPPED